MERVSGACKSGWASTLTLGSGRDVRSGTRNSCGALLPAGDTHQVAHVVLRGAEAKVVHLRGQIRAGEEQGKGPGASGRGAQLGRTHTLRDTMLLMSGGPRGAPSAMSAGVLAKGGFACQRGQSRTRALLRHNHVRDSAAARRAEGPRGCVPPRLPRCPTTAHARPAASPTGWVTSIASPVSLDGPDILLSSSRDKSVILWTLTREEAGPTGAYGFPRRALRGHAHFVQDVVISSDAQVSPAAGHPPGRCSLVPAARCVRADRPAAVPPFSSACPAPGTARCACGTSRRGPPPCGLWATPRTCCPSRSARTTGRHGADPANPTP